MEWVETTGRTVEEAKDAALDQLGVDELDSEIEVLGEVKTGLFGRVRAPARVRARVKPTPARPRTKGGVGRQRRPRVGAPDGGGEEGNAQGRNQLSDRVETEVSPGPAPGTGDPPDRAPSSGPMGEAGTAAGAEPDDRQENGGGPPAPVADSGRSASLAGGPVDTDGWEGSVGHREGESRVDEPPAGPLETNGGDVTDQEEVSLADQGEIARRFLVGLLERFDVGGSVEVTIVDDETVEVGVGGRDIGLLIGPRGETLGALQELTRTVVQRQVGRQHGRLQVDVGGYRRKRRDALEAFTRRIAEEVGATGVAQVLEPMGPADRKTIHDTVNVIAGVATTSEGEEPRRHVVIRPAGDMVGPGDDG